jgi:hypothetical protein
MRWTAAAAMLVCATLPCAVHAEEWNFSVFLDDKPIGAHRFSVTGPAEARKVLSEAAFAVKLLGLTVYRYRHRAVEQWRGDCLRTLDASTDDDGEASRVRAEPAGDGLAVTVDSGTAAQTQPGCVMSFAYWNPAIQRQARLLNAQTGRHESVQVRPLGGGTLDVRGQRVAAMRWRIEGAAQPIDVWYSAEGEWLGLDSTVEGGRRLSYRLK